MYRVVQTNIGFPGTMAPCAEVSQYEYFRLQSRVARYNPG